MDGNTSTHEALVSLQTTDSPSQTTNVIFTTGNITHEVTTVLSPPYVPSSIHTVAAIITFSLIWIFGVLGNLLVCIVIHRSRRLQSTTNYFIVALAVVDLLYAFTVMPFLLGWVISGSWVFGTIMCKVVRLVQYWLPPTTFYIMLSICIDRFYTILYPLSFKVTRGRAKQLIGGSWGLGAVLGFPALFIFENTAEYVSAQEEIYQCQMFVGDHWGNVTYLILLTILGFIVPTIAVIIGYTKIFFFIWKAGIGGRTFQRTMNPVPRAKVKTVKMIMILNTVTLLLILPFYAIQLWYLFSRTEETNETLLFVCMTWIYCVSTVSKPSIYTCYNSNFRRGCKEVFCMSTMKCYRSNAYTITTTSKFAKKNHIGVDPNRDYQRMASPSKTFDRAIMIQTSTWPLTNSAPSTYL